MTDFEVFYDELKENNGTLTITIPYKVAKFAGYEKGDFVKVMVRKARKEK